MATLKTKPSGSRTSIRDVARKAGVSPGCVSNVINGRRKQNDPIGRAVLQAVEDLDYRRNTMASNLRRSQSRIIGLVIPDFENPFFAELVAELARCAEATTYRIVATSSHESTDTEAREIDELVGWRVAGILLIPALQSQIISSTALNEAPFVVMDRITEGCGISGVGVNNADASAATMRNLLNLGHRRILVAYIGEGIGNVAERLDGVRQVAAEMSGRIQVDYLPTGDSVEGARAALGNHLDNHPDPDAVFCLFNTATLAAYGLMQERGLAPGYKTALVGFDDSAWMAHVHPPVAAIVQPVKEIAKQAWGQLLTSIEGNAAQASVTRIPCRLEERGTLIKARE